jgi:hypothetical protein
VITILVFLGIYRNIMSYLSCIVTTTRSGICSYTGMINSQETITRSHLMLEAFCIDALCISFFQSINECLLFTNYADIWEFAIILFVSFVIILVFLLGGVIVSFEGFILCDEG